jgi:phosphohistidine phosphatase
MKTIYAVRHAKSSWGDFTLPDFERPLNDRGKNDAPAMAQRLLKRNASIDAFISSPAKRAFSTCKLFCREYNYPVEKIISVDELYHAPKQIFYEVITKIDDACESAAVFSHNPGITDFVNSLGLDVVIDNMPTCAVFAVSAQIITWKDFEKADKTFVFFDYPKSV